MDWKMIRALLSEFLKRKQKETAKEKKRNKEEKKKKMFALYNVSCLWN